MKSTQLGGIANLALLAQLKAGFVPGAESFTYAQRLDTLFKTLNAIRLATRESTLSSSPFPDAIGRWGILQSFRYALIPPEIGDSAGTSKPKDALAVGTYRLYLSVTFDGGWEPYIRVIYRDLGSLLDTIFTNCEGYPLSREHSFDTYTSWVRSREIPGGIFYTESPKSVVDQRYLEAVEQTQRQASCPTQARKDIATFAVKTAPDVEAVVKAFDECDPETKGETIRNNFKALKALYDLRALYAAEEDPVTLQDFAIRALPEFRALLSARRNEMGLSAPYLALADWLIAAPGATTQKDHPRAAAVEPQEDAQVGVLSGYTGVTHGVLFLLAVADPSKTREFLAGLPLTTEASLPIAKGQLYCNVAFTRQGLEALQAPSECLDALPREFVEGMEARAGMLGDVRGNHPEHWHRPTFADRELDLGSIHIVLQYRLADGDSSDGTLHPQLQVIGEKLATDIPGVRLLSVEPMRSSPTSDGHSVENFGFKDGFSQPVVRSKQSSASPPKWDDSVALGELLLGHPNDHDDGPYPPAANGFLDNGSFLVLRKIRQNVDAWNEVLRQAVPGYPGSESRTQSATMDLIAAKLLGRDKSGSPLAAPGEAGNDFNYDEDRQGSRCPFQSHVRRANPRRLQNGKRVTPRLVRRGMSYGPSVDTGQDAERGLYFMAYCGSIAEQFEIVQRWIAGGNSTGVLAAHSDPMLGVPQSGVPRSVQWLNEAGEVVQIDLGATALTELQWGLYLFAPSRTGLSALARVQAPRSAPPTPQPWSGEAYHPKGPVFEERRSFLQDRDRRDLIWRRVNAAGGQVQTAYGLLVSDPAKSMAILRDDGSSFSVCGYGRRFSETIGMGFLGLDASTGHTRLAEDSGIKDKIAAIDEQTAFAAACMVTEKVLAVVVPQTAVGQEIPLDVLELNEKVLAQLCKVWFGLPDESFLLTGTSAKAFADQKTDLPCCPRDFVHVARHIFGPHPTPLEQQRGKDRGQAIHKGVVDYLKSAGAHLVGLSRDISVALSTEGADVIAQTIAGVMLGFAPSVHGNFTNVMRAWVEHKTPGTPSIWDLQTRLLQLDPGQRATYVAAKEFIRPELINQMRQALVPPAIWRECPVKPADGSAVTSNASPPEEPPKIVIGLQGLMQHDDVDETLMFGGAMRGDRGAAEETKTDHACPGHGMAIGVLLGVITTLLLVGTLRATPSYTLLNVVR